MLLKEKRGKMTMLATLFFPTRDQVLPVLRYKDTGLRKRAEWERTWELQREEGRLTLRHENKLMQRCKGAKTQRSKEASKLGASVSLCEARPL